MFVGFSSYAELVFNPITKSLNEDLESNQPELRWDGGAAMVYAAFRDQNAKSVKAGISMDS